MLTLKYKWLQHYTKCFAVPDMPQEAVTAEGILSYIDKNGAFNSQDYANSIGEDHQKIVGIIKSLQGLGQVRSTSVTKILVMACMA